MLACADEAVTDNVSLGPNFGHDFISDFTTKEFDRGSLPILRLTLRLAHGNSIIRLDGSQSLIL